MTPDDLSYRRQLAINNLLRLMGCTDAKASKCEHVAAIAELGKAMSETTFNMIDDLVGGVLSDYGLKVGMFTAIKPGVTGHREGKMHPDAR